MSRSKFLLMKALLRAKPEKMIIGGSMALTFLKMHDKMAIGSSLYDDSAGISVHEIMKMAADNEVEIMFPADFKTVGDNGMGGTTSINTVAAGIPDWMIAFDCGPATNEQNKAAIQSANTIIWRCVYVQQAGKCGDLLCPVGASHVGVCMCNKCGNAGICCVLWLHHMLVCVFAISGEIGVFVVSSGCITFWCVYVQQGASSTKASQSIA